MTKRDYVKLAEIIKRNTMLSNEDTDYIIDSREKLLNDLCSMLALDNPNFNKDRFIQACNKEK